MGDKEEIMDTDALWMTILDYGDARAEAVRDWGTGEFVGGALISVAAQIRKIEKQFEELGKL